MSIARATRRMLAGWGVLLLLTGCALPMPNGDSPSSYPGAGGGYSGASGGDRVGARLTLGPRPAERGQLGGRPATRDAEAATVIDSFRSLDERWPGSSASR